MDGEQLFFADQHLANRDSDKLSKNAVITKFKHFIKVSQN